jgi:hypothetical protein
MFWILELFDAGLEAGDGFAQKLCARLTLAIVVLAQVLLFGTNTLLTGRFCAVTALGQGGISTRATRVTGGNHHFSLPTNDKDMMREELWGRAGCTDLQRRHALPLWRVGGVLRDVVAE